VKVNYIVGDGPHGGHFTKFFLEAILRCVSCYNYCQIMDWFYNTINVLIYHEVVKCWVRLIECSTLIIYLFPKFLVWYVYWLRFCFQTFVKPLGFCTFDSFMYSHIFTCLHCQYFFKVNKVCLCSTWHDMPKQIDARCICNVFLIKWIAMNY